MKHYYIFISFLQTVENIYLKIFDILNSNSGIKCYSLSTLSHLFNLSPFLYHNLSISIYQSMYLSAPRNSCISLPLTISINASLFHNILISPSISLTQSSILIYIPLTHPSINHSQSLSLCQYLTYSLPLLHHPTLTE